MSKACSARLRETTALYKYIEERSQHQGAGNCSDGKAVLA